MSGEPTAPIKGRGATFNPGNRFRRNTREAVVDGLFYPAAPRALRAHIVDYLVGAGAAVEAGRAPESLYRTTFTLGCVLSFVLGLG